MTLVYGVQVLSPTTGLVNAGAVIGSIPFTAPHQVLGVIAVVSTPCCVASCHILSNAIARAVSELFSLHPPLMLCSNQGATLPDVFNQFIMLGMQVHAMLCRDLPIPHSQQMLCV